MTVQRALNWLHNPRRPDHSAANAKKTGRWNHRPGQSPTENSRGADRGRFSSEVVKRDPSDLSHFQNIAATWAISNLGRGHLRYTVTEFVRGDTRRVESK